MKKVLAVLGTLLITSTLFTSCSTTNKGIQSSPVISRNVHLDPIKADIKVDNENKLSGESSSAYLLFFRVSGDNTFADGVNYSTAASASLKNLLNPFKFFEFIRLNKVRSAAAYNALSFGNCDVLVHPTYTNRVENYILFKRYTSKVEGYGAKYENFRTEKQKIVILENGKELILQDN